MELKFRNTNYIFDIVSILYDGGRSGSVFLQSLFDGHEECVTFPATLLCGGLTTIPIEVFYAQYKEESSTVLSKKFIETYLTAFDSTFDMTAMRLNELGLHKNEKIKLNQNYFQLILEEILESHDKNFNNFFLAIHLAYKNLLTRSIPKRILIIHALHTPEPKIKFFCESFPNQKIIVCVRDPIISHDSRFKHHIRRHNNFDEFNFFSKIENIYYPKNMINDLLNSFKIINKVSRFNNIYAVRNEILHLEPEKSMQKIANILGIKYSDILLESSFNGKLHWGDVTTSFRNGFTRKVSNKFDLTNSTFTYHDVQFIENLIEKRILHFNYNFKSKKMDIRKFNHIFNWELIVLKEILKFSDSFFVFLKFISRFEKLFIFLLIAFKLLNKKKRHLLNHWLDAYNKKNILIREFVKSEDIYFKIIV